VDCTKGESTARRGSGKGEEDLETKEKAWLRERVGRKSVSGGGIRIECESPGESGEGWCRKESGEAKERPSRAGVGEDGGFPGSGE